MFFKKYKKPLGFYRAHEINKITCSGELLVSCSLFSASFCLVTVMLISSWIGKAPGTRLNFIPGIFLRDGIGYHLLSKDNVILGTGQGNFPNPVCDLQQNSNDVLTGTVKIGSGMVMIYDYWIDILQMTGNGIQISMALLILIFLLSYALFYFWPTSQYLISSCDYTTEKIQIKYFSWRKLWIHLTVDLILGFYLGERTLGTIFLRLIPMFFLDVHRIQFNSRENDGRIWYEKGMGIDFFIGDLFFLVGQLWLYALRLTQATWNPSSTLLISTISTPSGLMLVGIYAYYIGDYLTSLVIALRKKMPQKISITFMINKGSLFLLDVLLESLIVNTIFILLMAEYNPSLSHACSTI